MNTAEWKAVKEGWGSWVDFMQSYGLKPYDNDDIKEAREIVKDLTEMDQQQETSAGKNGGHGSGSGSAKNKNDSK